MQVMVFYYIPAQGLDVSAEEIVAMSVDDVILNVLPWLHGDEDFLGLMDTQTTRCKLLLMGQTCSGSKFRPLTAGAVTPAAYRATKRVICCAV